MVVFLPGAAGDVTQVDNRSPYQIKQFGEVSARFVGRTRRGRGPQGAAGDGARNGPLSPRGRRDAGARHQASPAAARACGAGLKIVEKDPKSADATEWTFAKETVVLDASNGPRAGGEVEVQAVQVGPAVFVACPAEYFCQFGLEIKARSGFPFTFPVSLANDASATCRPRRPWARAAAATRRG